MENRSLVHIRRCKIVFVVVLAVVNVLSIKVSLIVVSIVEYDYFSRLFSDIIELIVKNFEIGIFVLTGGYILAIALMIPTTLFVLAMGIVFKRILGTIAGYFTGLFIGSLSTVAGCSLAFFLSRYLLKSTLLSYVSHSNYRARAILLALKNNGFKLVTLFRLAPIFPFSLLNYALGASTVSYKNYVLGSIGLFPKLAFYFYISTSIDSIADAEESSKSNKLELIILLSIGAFFSILAGLYMTILARREMNRILDETETTILAENESQNMDGLI